MRSRVRAVFSLLEDISAKLASMPCMRLLSQTEDKAQVSVSALEAGGVTSDLVFSTVSPALAFQVMQNQTTDRWQFKDKNSIIFFLIFTPTTYLQYCGPSAPATEGRVPAYTDNLNSWLGQILQRDAPHIPVEIVDVETTGYVLRLCPFEDVAMVGLSADDVESFLQVVIPHFFIWIILLT